MGDPERAVWAEFYEEDPDTGKIDLADMAQSMAGEIVRLREEVAYLELQLFRGKSFGMAKKKTASWKVL